MKIKDSIRLVFRFIFLLLLNSFLSSVCAQKPYLQFVKLTPDNGLSSSIISSITQDERGFIWIGTTNGLNRYDGFNFVIYKNIPTDSTSIVDNVVRTIFQDHKHELFIGTEHGLSLYDRKNDRFINYMYEKSSPLNGIACSVAGITEDAVGNLWLATTVGLIYYDRNKNSIIQYTHDNSRAESLSDNIVEGILLDKSGRFWVSTRGGLNIFLPEKGIFKHITRDLTYSADVSKTIFLNEEEDYNGNIWIGSTDGLFCYKSNNEKEPGLIHYKHSNKDKSSLSIDQISSLFVDNKGRLWIGTENGGINLFDPATDSFWHYRKDDYDPQSLNNESIETIYQDESDNLWFGTYTGGLNIAMKNRDAFIKFQNLPGAPLSLSHNTITCFLEDYKNNVWIGTDGGGLNLFDDQKNRFTHFSMENSAIGSNSILCALEDSSHMIWLGTWAGGLVHFDPRTRSFRSYTTRNSKIPDNSIFAISPGFNNDLWLGSFEHGLIHYDIKENMFTEYSMSNSGLSNEMVVKIVKFSKGRLLIGNTQNFQIFSPSDGKFITYSSDPHNTNSISYSRINDILVQNDSCIWLGTPGGLNRFNPVTGFFTRYNVESGLPDNFITALALDKSSVLWITTIKGICRFDYSKSEFKTFTKADGLQGNEFSERSILSLKNGAVLMGGVKGFNILYPDKIIENKTIPRVVITDFKIFNKNVKPGITGSPLPQNISDTKSLVLPYTQSVLTFSFAVMDFSASEKNQYAYKMENFDKEWIYPGNKGEVTYTNLSPGDYVFRVKGSNNDGLWNDTGTSLKLTILPPWWATWWFRILFISGIVIAFSTFFILRVRQLKSQKIKLEMKVEMKTAELKELNASKDKFFSIIAHDLKNPFSTIIGFSQMLNEECDSKNYSNTNEYIKVINTSAVQTLRLLENLLEWAKSQSGKLTFIPVTVNLSKLLEDEFLILDDIAKKKNIRLINSVDDSITIEADFNMLRTILRNLISNAIKFTYRNGKVEVKANIRDGIAEVSVADNGMGMSKEVIGKLFKIDANLSTTGTEEENGTGLGLFLCKEFVEKHGGKIFAESEEHKGSSFKFILPAKNDSSVYR